MKYRRLRAEMVKHGDNQSTLAVALLLCWSALSQRFNTRQPWKLDEMYAIMDRYHIPYSELHKVFPKGGIDLEA